MPAKKTVKKAVKKAPASAKGGSASGGKKTSAKKAKKSTGTCTVCSVGVKPMAKGSESGPKAGLHMKSDGPVTQPVPEPNMPGPESMSCSRCDHIPGRVSAVIGLLTVVIVLLSVTVLTSVMVISSQAFQIEAYNSSGAYIDNVARK